jgi:hypothetical protein
VLRGGPGSYVIMDVFSRYVVGWTVQHKESAAVAKQLIAQAALQQKVPSGQLTLHADRGSSMTSKSVAFLLADLGVTKTHSRPYTSTDNPYSEQFKTLKYCPDFPDRFQSIVPARSFCRPFFHWYNHEHRALGGRADDAGSGSLRTCRKPPRGARSDSGCCLCRHARAIRPRTAAPAGSTFRGLGRPTIRYTGGCSLIVNVDRLTDLDRLRRSCRWCEWIIPDLISSESG